MPSKFHTTANRVSTLAPRQLQLLKNFPPLRVAPATVTSMTVGESWPVKREVDGTIPSTARSRESKGVTLAIHAIQVPHNCKSGEHARASPAPAREELPAPACGSCHRDIYDSWRVVATRQRPKQHLLTRTSMNKQEACSHTHTNKKQPSSSSSHLASSTASMAASFLSSASLSSLLFSSL